MNVRRNEQIADRNEIASMLVRTKAKEKRKELKRVFGVMNEESAI